MASDNSVTLAGNLVDDPELRFTANGQAMARMRLAVSRRWTNQQGEWQEDTSFFTVTAWRELAENLSGSLVKGTRVIVSGRMQQRSWENPDGDKRSVVEVQADDIGPSLRWATAEIRKRSRNNGDALGRKQASDAEAEWPEPAVPVS